MTDRLALVTGATGGLGRHLVGKLTDAGYHVRASGRNQNVGDKLASTGAEFVPGDLRDDGHIHRLAKHADVVFHCAALSSPWGKATDFQTANVAVTRSLARAAIASGCQRFVHVSSPAIYFRFTDQIGIREDAELPGRFANHYAETKAMAELEVHKACEGRIPASIIRPRGIFGEYDDGLVPRLLEMARGGRIPVFNNGRAIVDVTYAGNVADAMLLCDRSKAPSGAFNITNGEPVSVRDLLARLFEALNLDVKLVPAPYSLLYAIAGGWELAARTFDLENEPRILRYSLGLMNYSQTLDITAARTQLHYHPAVSIDEGLKRFARWYGHGNARGSATGALQTGVPGH